MLYLSLLIALALVGLSCGQYEYPNYEETAQPENPSTYPDYSYPDYPNPDYSYPDYPNYPAQPQYPDYSEVETVETTTTTTTAAPLTKRPQVFPRTPTRRRPTRRQQPNRIVRWYFMDSQGIPVRTAVARRYRSGSWRNAGLPEYYRSMLTGSRSLGSTALGSGLQKKRVEYWWYMKLSSAEVAQALHGSLLAVDAAGNPASPDRYHVWKILPGARTSERVASGEGMS
uniref:Uncharacterized protein n=1 Tax=Anopheles farauti TaxID=69004 RepID=A0A182QLR2_9DIPT